MDAITMYMNAALDSARTVKGFTAPNPAVGAVIVRDGVIIATGSTSPAGGDHAEIHAIRAAGENCRGAELYVTLEPCSHWGKTPPCSEAVIAAGFSKVIIAMEDPNPLVSGRGTSQIRAAGIEVITGICETEAHQLNEDFFYYITHKKPWVTVKLAMTLDGRVADSKGSSQWITGPESRRFVHELRAKHTAIGVGRGTLETDNPQLTVRGVEGKNPIRIAFVSDATAGKATWFRDHARDERTIMVISDTSNQRIETASDGVELWFTGSASHLESLDRFLTMAGEQEIDSLFVEGGSGLVSTFLELRAVNRFYLFYAPKLLGGGTDGLVLAEPHPMNQPIALDNPQWHQFGNDMMITGVASWL